MLTGLCVRCWIGELAQAHRSISGTRDCLCFARVGSSGQTLLPLQDALCVLLGLLVFGLRPTAVSINNESDQAKEGHSVDALALRGDEGRGTLR